MFLHHKNTRFYDFSIKPTKKTVALKGTNKNDVMRQAGFVGDSYDSKTTPLKSVVFKVSHTGDVLCWVNKFGDSYIAKTSPLKFVAFNNIFESDV